MGLVQSYNLIAAAQWYFEGSRFYGANGFKQAKINFRPDDIRSMAGKVVAVTGSNKGIGFSVASGLAALDAEVHMICRDISSCEKARDLIQKSTKNDKIYCHCCDVSSMTGIREFADIFTKKVPRLDTLVLNAGCMPVSRHETAEGNEAIMATTLGGTLLLTDLLVPILSKANTNNSSFIDTNTICSARNSSSRVIIVSSGGAYSVKAKVNDLNSKYLTLKKYDSTLIYAFAKRNQIEISDIIAEKLYNNKHSILVHSMHPGWADTEGLRDAMESFYTKNKNSLRTSEQGADTIIFLASSASLDEEDTRGGKFWFDRKPVKKHFPFGGTKLSEKEKLQLWDNASRYVGGLLNIK